MGRQENVEIFDDTMAYCSSDEDLKANISKSTLGQLLILENDIIPHFKAQYKENADVIVSDKRTFQAAESYAYAGKKVCVLNFASATNPGGGVLNGAGAQEECLCRCSTLYFNLTKRILYTDFYIPHRNLQNPLHNNDIIYSPDVTVFKSDTESPALLDKKDWFSVNVISCAAPNLRFMPQGTISNEEIYTIQLERFSRILSVAAAQKNEVVILGAFGCGAFKNDANVVAEAAKNSVREFLKYFETIEFAIYCKETDKTNFTVFRDALKDL